MELPPAVKRSVEIRDSLVVIPTVDFDALLGMLIDGVKDLPDPQDHDYAVRRFRLRNAVEILTTYSPTHLQRILSVKPGESNDISTGNGTQSG